MHLFFSVGEPSGDEHAGELIGMLRSRGPLRAAGFGGPQMEAAGQEQMFPLCDLAVMGIQQIAPQLKTFFRLADEAEDYFRRERPDAVVLVDYPGFNWHIARRAKKYGIPVAYYMPPQLWAWAPWRIRKARRLIDLVLSGLPFEADWYRERGVPVAEVSHPFFDEVARHEVDEAQVEAIRRSGRPLAILPGSRNSELKNNFSMQLSVARRLYARHPDLHFHVAAYKPAHEAFCRDAIAREAAALPMTVHRGCTSEVIEAADAVVAVSGSVSLELLARRKPTTVMYRLPPATGVAGHFLVRTPWVSLPNLIAQREVMPELKFIRRRDRNANVIAADVHEWLADDTVMAAKVAELDAVAKTAVKPGGTLAAAEAIEAMLGQRSQRRRAA